MQVITLQYALDPNKKQEMALKSHEGAVRYAYNWSINKIYNDWNKNSSLKEQNKPTDYKNYSFYSLRKEFNSVKDIDAPWWKENSKEAYNTGFENASKSLKNYFSKRTGLPKFKKKNSEHCGIHFTTGAMKLIDNRHFQIPKIGVVRLHENPRKLCWLLKQESARIMSIWVKYARCRWFLSIILEVSDDLFLKYVSQRRKRDRKKAVGVDVGVKSAAVFSDGTVIDNPRRFERSIKKLRRLQRELSRRRGDVVDDRTGEIVVSHGFLKSKFKLQREYARVINFEVDFVHKLSKSLCDGYDLIGLEDLNVRGLLRNHRLARSISHAGFGRLRVFLDYKCRWYGNSLVFVDRFYPSSKTCSRCLTKKANLSLSERVFVCEVCNLVIDRDLNAALNILNEALRIEMCSVDAQSCGESLNGYGDGSAGFSVRESETFVDEVLSSI